VCAVSLVGVLQANYFACSQVGFACSLEATVSLVARIISLVNCKLSNPTSNLIYKGLRVLG
jgi:hypothetical protein